MSARERHSANEEAQGGVGKWRQPATSQLPQTVGITLAAALFSGLFIAMGGYLMKASAASKAEAMHRLVAAHDDLMAAPALASLDFDQTKHGRDLFMGTCVACHGAEGTGIAGLGKDLTTSPAVAAMTDTALLKMITTGRPQGKPVPMPPKGGNDALSEADLVDIVAYVRGLQDPRRLPDLPAFVAAGPSEADKAKALDAAGGDAELAGFIAHGSQVFASSCSACHGKDAKGLKGNGKDLVNSDFCKSLSDDDMLAFIKKGRDPGDPANTTGVGMPAKGGNPALSDDDILDVIEYLRSLRSEKK